MPELDELLRHLVDARGSDLHIKVGSPPYLRVEGHLTTSPFESVDPAFSERLAVSIMPEARAKEFMTTGEADFAHSVTGLGRFRVNVYRQRGSVGLVFRYVAPGIPSWDQLGLPHSIERIATEEARGLVVVGGPTGSGKTTTVNAIVDRINSSRPAQIVTIEDPIEYLHQDKMAFVSQREIGTDTTSFGEATKRAMRQGADVIVIGEVRDRETLAGVLAAAETGHLVITSMRTSSAAETVTRLLEFYPPDQQAHARETVARALRMVVAQRLLERADGKGRTPAVEVLVNTPKVYACIVDPTGQPALERIMAEGEYHGMQTFDQNLLSLYKDGLVSARDALAVASQPEDLRIALQSTGMPSSSY